MQATAFLFDEARLCSLIQIRTILLICQGAHYREINNQERLPRAASRAPHQSRNWVVMELPGRPVTKRSHIWSRCGSSG
jgi:hypothetical protein